MYLKVLIAVALAAAFTVSATALGHERAGAATKRCASVAFTPDSEDLASDIRATGLTCGLARDFIRDSAGRPGPRFRGFRCASTSVNAVDALPYRRYRCTGAGDVIRWRRY
ncbi:MAG TPA: hypothetical protein VM299_04915 [Solirubrobacteraceae bacterium]|nr:hypothetical protein [Solirubrobacteraceae bacterium]